RSIGKRQFGQGSWPIVAPRRNASKMVIFHPIKFKSFPTPIAVSSSWTMDCRREPTFPRTLVMAHICVSVYDHLQNRWSISRRKLAFYLCLQEFPGQTNHPGAGCRCYALHARSTGARALLERLVIH